ncbi:MAG: TolC family protein [Deltaproteobacteria bacterium]|nr:TolC family protein [Deltaproteobacteria bacterium]
MTLSKLAKPVRSRINRRMRALLISSVFALFVLSSLAPGRAFAEDETKTITLDEAYRLAISSHEAIKIAGEGAMQAGAQVDKAVSQILPKLTAEGSYTAYSKQETAGAFVIQPDDASRVDVRLTQPLYTGGREWAARRQARIISSKSMAGQEAARDEVIRLTARAYYGVLKADREIEIKTAALKRAEERRKIAAARLKVGEVTRASLLRSEALLAGAQAGLISAEAALKDAQSLFARITGMTGAFQLVEPPVRAMGMQETDELVKTALEQRSDYRQSLLDEKAADEGISYAKSWFMPSLRFEGLYSWREQSPKTTFFQKESVSGSLVLAFPIFEGGLRYAELSEARSKHRESEFRRLSLRRDIEVQVREAVDRLEAVSAVIETYKKQLSFAEEDARMVAEQFKYGLAAIVDVIDADGALIDAQRSLMNATYDYELAKLALKAVTGRLGEEVMVRDEEHGLESGL